MNKFKKIFTKKNLPMIIAVAVVAAALIGGGITYLVKDDDPGKGTATEQQGSQNVPVPKDDETKQDDSKTPAEDEDQESEAPDEEKRGSNLPDTDRDATIKDVPEQFPLVEGASPKGFTEDEYSKTITFTIPDAKEAVKFYKETFIEGDYYVISQSINKQTNAAAKWELQGPGLPPNSSLRIYDDNTMVLVVTKEA